MDYVLLQILTAIGVFISLVICSYIPYCIIQYRDRTQSALSRRKSSVPILSLCNCFAAGVFLATCFLGMVPHVQVQVAEWMEKQQHKDPSEFMENGSAVVTSLHHGFHNGKEKRHVPVTEIMLIGGFLMMLLLEEIINLCQRYCGFGQQRRDYNSHVIEETTTRLQTVVPENEPLLSDDESGPNHHTSMTMDPKPATHSPLNALRMSDMGGPLRSQRSDLPSHDHQHHHNHIDAGLLLSHGGRSLSWRSVALLLGLGIHGLFEGIALGLQDTRDALFGLLFGVMSHEVLCAMAFGINLASHRASVGVAFLATVLFSLSIPFGMAGGTVLNRRHAGPGGGDMVRITLEGLAAGTFVYVSFMDMLAHEFVGGHSHEKGTHDAPLRMVKVLCVCAGFLLFLGLTFVA